MKIHLILIAFTLFAFSAVSTAKVKYVTGTLYNLDTVNNTISIKQKSDKETSTHTYNISKNLKNIYQKSLLPGQKVTLKLESKSKEKPKVKVIEGEYVGINTKAKIISIVDSNSGELSQYKYTDQFIGSALTDNAFKQGESIVLRLNPKQNAKNNSKASYISGNFAGLNQENSTIYISERNGSVAGYRYSDKSIKKPFNVENLKTGQKITLRLEQVH